jgi:hypothetical protein
MPNDLLNPVKNPLTLKYSTLFQMVEIYQEAFNAIDDLMEYRGMDKEQFKAIANRLHNKVKNIK